MVMVFIAVNQNGKTHLWLDEPIKKSGKWIGKYCYFNKFAIDKANIFVKETNMTFESEPVPVQF